MTTNITEAWIMWVAHNSHVLTAQYLTEDSSGFIVNEPDEILFAYGLRPLLDDMARRCSIGAFDGGESIARGMIRALYDARDADPLRIMTVGAA